MKKMNWCLGDFLIQYVRNLFWLIPGGDKMVEMSVDRVQIGMWNQHRVVVLNDPKSKRSLYIWIAQAEAASIAQELQGAVSPRPLTHDLLKTIILSLNAKIVQIEITKLVDSIYHAQIILDAAGQRIEIDARSSDAIAMALRFKCPIFAANDVLEKGGVPYQSLSDKGSRSKHRDSSDELGKTPFSDFILKELKGLDEL